MLGRRDDYSFINRKLIMKEPKHPVLKPHTEPKRPIRPKARNELQTFQNQVTNRKTGDLSKVATMIASFYNQRKKISLQSDCYPRKVEAIRLIKRKDSININQSDCWLTTCIAIRLKRPTLSLILGNFIRITVI